MLQMVGIAVSFPGPNRAFEALLRMPNSPSAAEDPIILLDINDIQSLTRRRQDWSHCDCVWASRPRMILIQGPQ